MKPVTLARRAIVALALLLAAACTTPGPARNDELFATIHRGMAIAEVRERLGPPDETMSFPLAHTTALSWFYYDTWGFYTEYSATFNEAGYVVSTFAKRVGYGGGSGAGGRD